MDVEQMEAALFLRHELIVKAVDTVFAAQQELVKASKDLECLHLEGAGTSLQAAIHACSSALRCLELEDN